MNKISRVLCLLLLPYTATATTIKYSNSCDSLSGKQARINCYYDYQKTIPLAKTKLADRQKLIDTYRCGNRLLQPEMTLVEAHKTCSRSYKPAEVEQYLESFEVHHRGYYGHYYMSFETYEMERWTFKRYGRFRTYIIFRDGIIYQIIQDNSVRN